MIRLYNGRVLTMDGNTEIKDGEVWTDGGKIAYIGKTPDELPAFEREIDLRGDLVMPGFKNAHTHSAMTFLRSYADDLPLKSWLFDKVFPMEDKLTPENIYVFNKIAVMEYLTSGITAAFDMYFFNEDYARSCADSGFRTVICGAISDMSSDKYVLEKNFARFNNFDPLVSYCLGFHAEYTTGKDLLKYVADASKALKAPVFTHNSETKSEVEECIARHGMTPTELFESLGVYDNGGGGYHCVYLSDSDIEIFKKRGLWAVTNPGSNSKLASGIAPIAKYMEKGLNLAIGTDGPASNNALDMFREMYLVTVLQKILCSDAAICGADEVLKMATVGGARAMGLNDCDVLAVGKQADLTVIDMSRPNMKPENNIVKNIVYSGSKENVRLTMVAGKVLYEDGEFFIGESPERIYAEAERMVKKMKES